MKRSFITVMSLLLLMGLGLGLGQGAYAQTSAPVAENLELSTYRNTSVGGCLSAYDPEGGELKYIISTEPVKGSIQLDEDGSFVYTPEEGKKGRDYFGYKVCDSEGNMSQEATVIIRIEKQTKDVSYTDMKGRADEYSALLLCERDIFTGEQLGGQYCFNPEKKVTRGEFLSVCMLISDTPNLNAVLNTGYADDAAIPTWMKSYAVTAAMRGVYQGVLSDAGAVFAHDEHITKAEAALMLDKALNITRVNYIPLDEYANEDVAQACVNLSACGVLDDAVISPDNVTRADMARMIASAIMILDKR